jgi:hypothetical protein
MISFITTAPLLSCEQKQNQTPFMRKNFLQRRFSLPANDLLRDLIYRRLWTSILISSFGAQITMLALPLTAAVMLNASASQMGILTMMETLPFVLLSLPTGVWLDRMRKLPVYIAGETIIGWPSSAYRWRGGWIGEHALAVCRRFHHRYGQYHGRNRCTNRSDANRTAGTSGRSPCKNALATSGAEVAGPATAGALIKLLGAPLALIADAALLISSAMILRGIKVTENRPVAKDAAFWRDLKAGIHFVAKKPLLLALAATVGGWQLCYNAALVVQILYATRILGFSEQTVGLSYMGMGLGTILASVYGYRISRAIGPGLVWCWVSRSAARVGVCWPSHQSIIGVLRHSL